MHERDAFGQLHHVAVDLCLDFYSAARVWARHLVTLETLLLVILTLASVSFFKLYYRWQGAPLAANLNWTFVSFALVFPLTFSLNEAFRRRELAALTIASMKADLLSLYYAHRDWDWPARGALSGGRAALPANHLDDVRSVLLDLNEAQALLLLKPNVGRARHFYTAAGRHKRVTVTAQKCELLQRIAVCFSRLSTAMETMKAAGLPGNEASRARHYSNSLLRSWEALRNVKRYRTPVTTSVFARLFILISPFLMGPYWAYIAGAGAPDGVQHTNFAFSCVLAVAISVALSALFNVRYALEDPFVSGNPDSLDVRRDMSETVRLLWLTADGEAADKKH
jgi:hypothetical protein